MKTFLKLMAIVLALFVTIGCQSQTQLPQAIPSESISKQAEEVDTSTDSVEELSTWDKFYLLSEEEQIEWSKDSSYSEFNYGSWNENDVLKFMLFICEDEPSSWLPYGSMNQFIDTTKLTKYKSALISYYCVPGAGSTGVINIFIQVNNKNEIFTKSVLTQVDDFFGFGNLELAQKQVNFSLSGYSSPELGMCCRNIQDSGKIYFKDGFPILEFTTFNDYRLYIYNLNYGPIFESDRFQLLVWGDEKVYNQDEIYRQAEKYNLRTGEIADGKEAIIKKACDDFAYAIPKTDLINRGKFIPLPEVRKMVDNWKKAAELEKELTLPLSYMRSFIEIATTEVISDDAWIEGLREFNMIPASEAEKLYAPLREAGSKINQSSNKVCDQYGLSFTAPNVVKD